MNDRKNYNSIVFLTTLSVYLGLVLAGGAMPTVLAQAATTRGFDIKTEIVIEDDLDKKPDETCSDLEKTAGTQLKSLDLDINDVSRLSEIVRNFILVFHDSLKQKGQKKDSYGEIERSYSGLDRSWCKQFERTISPCDNYFDFIFPNFHRDKGKSRLTESIQIDESATVGKFSFIFDSAEHSQSFASAYNAGLSFSRCKSKNTSLKVVYENTKAISENNQVFIVTRLPRGSIDALLAEKDAQ